MRAKKSLGQNFLNSKKAVADIISAANISTADTILEIGPGKGVLTEALLEKAGKVIAIEKDDDLIPVLKEKFAVDLESGKLELIHDDILEIDLNNVLPDGYKLIANIPYYITGLLFRRFLECEQQPEKMVLLVQKEVADRVVAQNGKESILSLSVKAYGDPRVVSKVPSRYFSPKPKVDSAILEVQDISKNFFDTITEEQYFAIVKTSFQHKRKLLRNNLELLFSKENVYTCFEGCSVNTNSRAEDLSRELYKCITLALHK